MAGATELPGVPSPIETAALPADVVALDLHPDPASPIGAISAEAAIAAADAYAELPPTALAEAYLMTATDDGTLRSDQPIKQRRIWLVRYTGFALEGAIPEPAPGESPGPLVLLRHGYVYVDAVSGEVLLMSLRP